MSEQNDPSLKSETSSSENSKDADLISSNFADELEKWKGDAEKYKNDFLYLRAEFENYKRNSIKERSDLVKFGAERFMRDLLEALDNFERALSFEVTLENFRNLFQGVQMTSQEIKGILSKHGVSEVPSDKTPFDPMIHEALGSEATLEVDPGFVLKTFKKAYKLHDKLLRPAQVVVAKKPE